MNKHVDIATLKARPLASRVRTINLALQGGGAHGAFTWGVLDRLLEEETIEFEGISATSAGAMNATVMAYGMTVGGRDGAKTALRDFWRRISHAALFSPLQPSLFDRLTHNHGLENSPAHLVFDILSRLLSPYQLNPLNHNPLRQPLEAVVDFERLNRGSAIKLFLSATNVRTCKVRIFTCAEVTADAVLASACLPFMSQAVEIDGEAYWDGGYMGNPAIFADLRLREPGRGHRPHQPDLSPRRADHGRHDHEPDQRDLLQQLAHARDAGRGLRQQDDRRRQGGRRYHEADADPRHRGRGVHARARRLLEAECRLELPHPPVPCRACRGRALARRQLPPAGAGIDGSGPGSIPLVVLFPCRSARRSVACW
jgi:hypothetical protein